VPRVGIAARGVLSNPAVLSNPLLYALLSKLFPTCGNPLVQQINNQALQVSFGNLVSDLSRLRACISDSKPCVAPDQSDMSLRVKPSHVFMTGYHDPARSDDGSFCDDAFLSSDAWTWAENDVVAPLNATLGAAARSAGWQPIGDFNAPPYQSSFLTHGYCAHDTWVRQWSHNDRATVDESLGTWTSQGNKEGFMHPNMLGHQRYAQSLATAANSARL
jgi:hypothetical protein